MRSAPALGLLLILSACGKADNQPGPGGVTVGEAKALDEAAEMLEDRRQPLDTEAPVPSSEAAPAAAAS